ncbi:aBC transporter ATP-binding protein [Prevotella sp. CAG:1320]|nr:aBC transporter ATP-binding protein [Prevotella sp. CAG:1320]
MEINVNQLKKSFGQNVAVDIDTLHIKEGEILGLVGNNGAGKTKLAAKQSTTSPGRLRSSG